MAAAPASASRRNSIGVVPAWSARPVTVTSSCAVPTIALTTASGCRDESSTPPCSMWSSTKVSISSRAAAATLAGSRPRSRMAAAISGSTVSIAPVMARDPQKLVLKREPSSSQIATTSSARRGLPFELSNVSTAVSPAQIPSAPSSLPPCRTVSICEPVTTAFPLLWPSARPQTLPTGSRCAWSPASFIQRSTRSTALAQASP